MNTKAIIARTTSSFLLLFAIVACDTTDDAGRDDEVRDELHVCMDEDLACGSDPALVDDPDADEAPRDGMRALERPGDLAAAPEHDEPVGSADMNCTTGSCICTNESYDSCVSKCTSLWDANCSKPASQQQVWHAQ